MMQITDEELLGYFKKFESEFNTMAEIHKFLLTEKRKCTIEELRSRILNLYKDGYVGKEVTGDGVNLYYLLFNPDVTE